MTTYVDPVPHIHDMSNPVTKGDIRLDAWALDASPSGFMHVYTQQVTR